MGPHRKVPPLKALWLLHGAEPVCEYNSEILICRSVCHDPIRSATLHPHSGGAQNNKRERCQLIAEGLFCLWV